MFKLSFGKQDKVALLLNRIEDSSPTEVNTDFIAERASSYGELRVLMRYVPFLLLRPFLMSELNSSCPHILIPRLANLQFALQNPPIYRFNSEDYSNCSAIKTHPLWALYFQQHAEILRGWHSWKWLKYLQTKNPYTPSLAEKLFKPSKRVSFVTQKKYWEFVIYSGYDVKCIYSGVLINQKEISHDHYLPWSFICHDEIWNLVPTLQTVNSSKSNRIPLRNRYFAAFFGLQHGALVRILAQAAMPKIILGFVYSFVSGLGVSGRDEIQSLESFQNAFDRNYLPLEEIAKNQGFNADWVFDPK